MNGDFLSIEQANPHLNMEEIKTLSIIIPCLKDLEYYLEFEADAEIIDDLINELQNKLLNKKLVINEPKLSKDDEENEVENDWKSGKCAACDLGRNVSLKGCSPYFCNKHTFKYSTKK